MSTLFGIDIAAEVAGAMTASDMTPAVLTHYAGTTPTPYDCHGVPPATKMQRQSDRSPNVAVGTGTARIVGKPLTDAGIKPEKGDLLTMDGVTYTVDDVSWDGYKAMFTLKVRGA